MSLRLCIFQQKVRLGRSGKCVCAHMCVCICVKHPRLATDDATEIVVITLHYTLVVIFNAVLIRKLRLITFS